MPSYFFTGASRGLGLALITKLLEDPSNVVVATARNPSAPGLAALVAKTPKERLHVFKLDVVDLDSYPALVKQVEAVLPNGLDYFIPSAGVDLQSFNTFGNDLDFNKLIEEFKINVVGPIALLKAFTPLIQKGTAKKAVFFSTELGSIAGAEQVPFMSEAYGTTKAALNMAARKYHSTLRASGSDIIILILYPGFVPSTDLGAGIVGYFNKYAPDYPQISLEDSVNGSLKVIQEATKEDAGKFLDFKKATINW